MADLNVALVLRLVDKATAPARAAFKAIERIGGGNFERQAARVRLGTNLMRDGLTSLVKPAIAAGTVIGTYKTLMAGLGLALIRPAANFERMQVQFDTLEGSAAAGKRAMDWVQDFATRTPISLEQTTAAYAKLKAFGVDPTNGSLQALVDTMAATGGGAEQLDGLVLGLGQAWSKGKLQGEEAMQLLERGVPVWDLLAKKLGKTSAEVQTMSQKGQLGRKEITLLVEAIGDLNKGASDKMAKTWDGLMSNILDFVTKFQVMVMKSGLFDYLKSRLAALLDLLNQMAADGRLLAWAESLGQAIQNSLETLWSIGSGIVGIWQDVYPWIERAKDALGGWKNLAELVIGLAFSKTLIGVSLAFLRVAVGAGVAVAGMVGFAAAAAARALTYLPTLLSLISAGLVRIAVAAWANPYLLIAAAIAVAAVAIWWNWDKIFAFLKAGWEAVTQKATAFWNWLTSLTWSDVGKAISDAFMSIDLVAAGVHLIESLWEGIRQRIDAMIAWVQDKLSGIVPDFNRLPGAAPTMGAQAISQGMSNPTGNAGRRALGGPVRAGQVYRWMEEGQEFFQPSTDGAVVSNRQIKALKSGGTRSVRIGDIIVNAAAGQSAEDIAREVMRRLERMAALAGVPLHDGGGYAA